MTKRLNLPPRADGIAVTPESVTADRSGVDASACKGESASGPSCETEGGMPGLKLDKASENAVNSDMASVETLGLVRFASASTGAERS